MSQWQPLGISIASLILYTSLQILSKRKLPLPPGPKGVPLLGNLFDLSSSMWEKASEMKVQYGPLTYLTVFGQGILIINDMTVADDLLNRRSFIYGDRPRWIVAFEILTDSMMMVLSKQTAMWKKMRRGSHSALNKTSAIQFAPIQRKEVLIMVEGLLNNPKDWSAEIRRYTTSSTWSMVYDRPSLSSVNDPAISKMNDFNSMISRSVYPGRYLVEFLPWLDYLPRSWKKWRTDAEEACQNHEKFTTGLYREVKKSIAEGDERPSVAAALIKTKEKHELTDTEAAWLCATVFGGGSETTAGVLAWFVLAMILYPEQQKRCQEELDSVIGRDRLPRLEDRNRLPYIQATVREALRWRPTFPLSVQHYTTKVNRYIFAELMVELISWSQDDIYNGYLIPKGTICLPNVWGLHKDKSIYGEDADVFNPERYIKKPELVKLKETKEGHFTYGFGSRICVGRYVADNSLFISVANILWATKICLSLDKAGKPIVPNADDMEMGETAVWPKPFLCNFQPRFPEAGEIVARARELDG